LTDDRAFGEDEVAGPYNRPKLRKLTFSDDRQQMMAHFERAAGIRVVGGPRGLREVSIFNCERLSQRLLILASFCFMSGLLPAQGVANGQQLTVTTANTVAT
jgi:hypothetical protein